MSKPVVAVASMQHPLPSSPEAVAAPVTDAPACFGGPDSKRCTTGALDRSDSVEGSGFGYANAPNIDRKGCWAGAAGDTHTHLGTSAVVARRRRRRARRGGGRTRPSHQQLLLHEASMSTTRRLLSQAPAVPAHDSQDGYGAGHVPRVPGITNGGGQPQGTRPRPKARSTAAEARDGPFCGFGVRPWDPPGCPWATTPWLGTPRG